MADLEAELIRAVELNLQIVLIIRGTPSWAQKVTGSYCGPVKADQLPAFGKFVGDVVARYSAAPYYVNFFEIGNEPDAPIISGDRVYGCWGDVRDYYRGGTYYAQALKTVYPAAKAANPNAQILLGGLLANCDPIRPPRGADCTWTRFLEGVVRNGGGPYFDGVSFHTYEYYHKAPGKWGNANWNSAYNTLGPVVIAKARYIKKVLANYRVTGKYLMDTEAALLCWDCTAAHQYEKAKAWYLPELVAAGMAEGVSVVVWYSYEGWLGSGLTDAADNPLPALKAFELARVQFGAATYRGRIVPADVGGATGITGYKFEQGNRTVWLLRSLDSRNRIAQFRIAPTRISDPLGGSIVPTTSKLTSTVSLTLTLQPVYVEWER
jgi:hypothetical protein